MALFLATTLPLPTSLAAQRTLVRSRPPFPTGFGGAGVVIAPRWAAWLDRVQLEGALRLGGGASTVAAGWGSVGVGLSPSLFIAGEWSGTRASAGLDARRDHTLAFALIGADWGVSAAHRSGGASLDQFATEFTGADLRGWLDVGPVELGLTHRTTNVVERGDGTVATTIEVAGYEFISRQRLNFLRATHHQDLQIDAGVDLAGLRFTGFIGHGFSDGEAPDRSWAFARLGVPLAERVEVELDAGRSAGVPVIGRMPENFVRIGFGVDLGPRREQGPPPPVPPAPAANEADASELPAAASIDSSLSPARLFVHVPGATSVEVRGDFTRWEIQEMVAYPDGSWSVEVPTGLQRFNIRIDGGRWGVPSGVTLMADEFSGAPVAVVVVPDAGSRQRTVRLLHAYRRYKLATKR